MYYKTLSFSLSFSFSAAALCLAVATPTQAKCLELLDSSDDVVNTSTFVEKDDKNPHSIGVLTNSQDQPVKPTIDKPSAYQEKLESHSRGLTIRRTKPMLMKHVRHIDF